VAQQVFMDETGIHDGSPFVAVAAYVAESATWVGWTEQWNIAKQPIKVVHAADCANLKGEFEDWTKEQRDAFAAKMLPILPAHKLVGLIFAIQMDDLRNGRVSTRQRCGFGSESYNSGKTEHAVLRQQVVDEPYAKRPKMTDRQPVQRQLLKGDTGRRAIEKGDHEPNYARCGFGQCPSRGSL